MQLQLLVQAPILALEYSELSLRSEADYTTADFSLGYTRVYARDLGKRVHLLRIRGAKVFGSELIFDAGSRVCLSFWLPRFSMSKSYEVYNISPQEKLFLSSFGSYQIEKIGLKASGVVAARGSARPTLSIDCHFPGDLSIEGFEVQLTPKFRVKSIKMRNCRVEGKRIEVESFLAETCWFETQGEFTIEGASVLEVLDIGTPTSFRVSSDFLTRAEVDAETEIVSLSEFDLVVGQKNLPGRLCGAIGEDPTVNTYPQVKGTIDLSQSPNVKTVTDWQGSTVVNYVLNNYCVAKFRALSPLHFVLPLGIEVGEHPNSGTRVKEELVSLPHLIDPVPVLFPCFCLGNTPGRGIYPLYGSLLRTPVCSSLYSEIRRDYYPCPREGYARDMKWELDVIEAEEISNYPRDPHERELYNMRKWRALNPNENAFCWCEDRDDLGLC